MSSANRAERLYRFDALDRSGVFLGLGILQLALLAAGLGAGTAAVTAGLPVPVAAAPVTAVVAAAFGRVGGERLVDWVPVAIRWVGAVLRRQRRWFAPLPLLHPSESAARVPLPPCLAGIALIEASEAWGSGPPAGLVLDRSAGSLAAVLRVAGDEFALLSRDDQIRLLAGWGDVLGGFATERGAVARICWSDHAATAGIGSHLVWLTATRNGHAQPQPGTTEGPEAAAAVSYRDLLATAASGSVGHDTTITVTVERSRLRSSRRRGSRDPDERLVSVLRTAVDAVCRGLRHAGLTPTRPLDVHDLAALVRGRCQAGAPLAASGSLATRLGLATPGPLAVEVSWGHVRTDGALHRTYWVAEWPRLAQHPDWLGPFLAHDSGAARTFTVVFEPVPPSESRRRIDRDSIRLETDATAREDKGRRVDAHHRRAQHAVVEREAELVAGYAELTYAGMVTVTAGTLDRLTAACDDLEATAREHGLELRALDGRHDLGWAAALPLGLGLGRTLP